MATGKGGGFSNYDKEALLDTVEKSTIKSKQNNARMILLKEKAWENVEEDF